ncbi:MAG: hypothetical protein QOG43_3406 [Actinomycetota bacterium]|jgi:hypothetical protein|nr:hypothetical protein [Actinomycetota bacterium]
MVDEEQLRETLHRRAETVEPSPNGWALVTRRIERRQRRTRTTTLSLAGGFAFAAVVVAVALVTHAIPETDQNVAAGGGRTPAFSPTTTVPFPAGPPTTVVPFDALPGQPTPGGPDDVVPPLGPTTIPGAGPDTGLTTSGFQTGTIYPETAAELERIQAQVDEGHQPWWIDPSMVASSYLSNRGLTTADAGAPQSIGEEGALRYTADGVGGWVSVGRLTSGSIYYVEGSRSDRIVQLRVARQGERLAVEVMAATGGKVVVRTKRPGSDWNPGPTQAVAAGKLTSLTVEGAAGADLIVQVRHEGDDGRVGLSEERMGAEVTSFEYEGLHDGSQLGPAWLGPVRLGMSLAEAARAAGVATITDRGGSCTTLRPAGAPAGVGFVSTAGDDRVDVITVGAPGALTGAGIGVGNTVAEVRTAYPGIEERLTLDGDGQLVYAPDDPVLGGFEMVFGMVDGRVASIWSGSAGLSSTDEICA